MFYNSCNNASCKVTGSYVCLDYNVSGFSSCFANNLASSYDRGLLEEQFNSFIYFSKHFVNEIFRTKINASVKMHIFLSIPISRFNYIHAHTKSEKKILL